MPRSLHQLVVIALLAGAAIAAGGLGQQDEMVKVRDYLSRHRAWSPARNTPGVTGTLEEVGRSTIQGISLVTYRMRVKGAPQEATYSLVLWQIDKPDPADAQTVLRGVTFNQEGVAICAGKPGTCGGPDKPDDPIDLALSAAKGEPKRVALVSADGGTMIFFQVVPFPLEKKDGGCTAEIVRIMPNAELLLVTGRGFPSSTTISLQSDSAGEKKKWTEQANDSGEFATAVLPFVAGKDSGTVKVMAIAEGCRPTVAAKWGKGSYEIE